MACLAYWIEGLQWNFGHPHCQNPVETVLLGTGSRPHMFSVCNLLFVVSRGTMMLNIYYRSGYTVDKSYLGS